MVEIKNRKKLYIGLVVGGIFLFLLILVAVKIISWILVLIYFIILLVAGVVGVIVYFVKPERKGLLHILGERKKYSLRELGMKIEEILKGDEYLDYMKEIESAGIGNFGEPPTPIYVVRGKGYYTSNRYVIIVNQYNLDDNRVLINPTKYDEDKAIKNLAERPEVYSTEETERVTPEGTQIITRKSIPMKDIKEEKLKEIKKKEEEI